MAEMKCIKCGSAMRLDDVDFNFKGNKDNYYICDSCHENCIEEIRYGKSVKTTWYDEDGNENG